MEPLYGTQLRHSLSGFQFISPKSKIKLNVFVNSPIPRFYKPEEGK